MFNCICGKSYKTEKGHLKHAVTCQYVTMNLTKVYRLGKMIHDCNKFLFHVHFGKVNKYIKENGCTREEAQNILLEQNIYKYRKTLWDILEAWKEEMLPSEYREFTKWIFKTYKDITLLSLRNTLSNPKIMYRFNLEHTADMIEGRIDSSLLYIHKNHTFHNDFDFVDSIMTGDVSMYYVLFNDWLATKWFGRLEADIQKELTDYVEIASKVIVNRVSHTEFDELQELSNTDTPKIYEM